MVREKLPVLPHRQPLWNGDKHFRVYNPRTEYIFILIKYPGGYSWEFLVGVCRPVLQTLARFQTWTLARNYVIIT